MATTITFGAYDLSVTLELVGRPFPEADSAWDQDAIDAQVEVSANAFSGSFATTVWSHEIAHLGGLLEELDSMVGQRVYARFRLREATLDLRFNLSDTGTLELRVRAKNDPASSCALEYTILADQTFLKGWIAQVHESLRHFPQVLQTTPLRNPLRVGV